DGRSVPVRVAVGVDVDSVVERLVEPGIAGEPGTRFRHDAVEVVEARPGGVRVSRAASRWNSAIRPGARPEVEIRVARAGLGNGSTPVVHSHEGSGEGGHGHTGLWAGEQTHGVGRLSGTIDRNVSEWH